MHTNSAIYHFGHCSNPQRPTSAIFDGHFTHSYFRIIVPKYDDNDTWKGRYFHSNKVRYCFAVPYDDVGDGDADDDENNIMIIITYFYNNRASIFFSRWIPKKRITCSLF